jgi:hypothetical protein
MRRGVWCGVVRALTGRSLEYVFSPLLPPLRACVCWSLCAGLLGLLSFSMEFTLPVGVARCVLSSLGMRPAALCIEPWEPELPSRLANPRSWPFFDLKRNAMVGYWAARRRAVW